ncbi:MAG: hypothetical protein MI924_09200 [Chloroflexales bacterium]|nr:hypothetical protein [Chloroflexales bacterium]
MMERLRAFLVSKKAFVHVVGLLLMCAVLGSCGSTSAPSTETSTAAPTPTIAGATWPSGHATPSTMAPTAAPTIAGATPTPKTQYLEISPASGEQFPVNREFPVRITLGYSAGEITFTPHPDETSGVVVTPRPIGTPGLPLQKQLEEQYGPGNAFITTRLTGSGDITPPEQVRYRLRDQDEITWVWLVVPKRPGSMTLFLEVFIEWAPDQGEAPTQYQVLAEAIRAEVYTPLAVFGNSIEFTTVLAGMGGMVTGAVFTWVGQRLAVWLNSRGRRSSWKAR